MKKWYKAFVYVSVIFLILALIKADYLILPQFYSFTYLGLSIFCLFLGFVFDAFTWERSLNVYKKVNVSRNNSIISNGLSIFGKYIPGKFWLIVGRAGYISEKYQIPVKDTALISLNAQFISIWVGLFLGCISLFYIKLPEYLIILSFSIWVIITLVLFTPILYNFLDFFLKKFFKRKFSIPQLKFSEVIRILPMFIFTWLSWCLGFWFMINSISLEFIGIQSSLIFALGGTLGIMLIIAPGGIGFREGIFVTLFLLMGLSEKEAVTISVSSRLWFLIGEVFIFFLAYILKKVTKNEQKII